MPFRLGYKRPLDGARAVAGMMVLGLHAGLPLMQGGAVGVDIFFVLNGFLITELLLEEWQLTNTISLKNFYFRRVLRLFPAFIALLAFCELYACLVLRCAKRNQSQIAVLASLGYCANWRRALLGQDSMGPLLSHTWSLSNSSYSIAHEDSPEPNCDRYFYRCYYHLVLAGNPLDLRRALAPNI
jgi:peptidoglycan/LPS O-acetylase OafA/YrhL